MSDDNSVLKTELQRFVHKHKYARLLPSGTLENWGETVNRCVEQLFAHVNGNQFILAYKPLVRHAIYNLNVTPSMRMLQMAGPACEQENACIYNCSYLEINCLESFDRLMYLSMCGCGVGFSVERRCVDQLPRVCSQIVEPGSTRLCGYPVEPIVVADTRKGWALAFRQWLWSALVVGYNIPLDISLVRPAGTPLKTTGGTASGPEALIDLRDYVLALLMRFRGKQLTSAACHRICCKIAQIVQCGGVRRSATISLSDVEDYEMRNIKNYKSNDNYAAGLEPHLNFANNSAVYHMRDAPLDFEKEWETLWESGSGERGIVSRSAMRQKTGRHDIHWGTNPCAEIILKPDEFCNLSSIVVRPGDTYSDLANKARLATLIGTLQATFIKFDTDVLGPQFRANAEEERLLGVSLNGQQQNVITRADGPHRLRELKNVVHRANEYYSDLLGIRSARRATCVKPHGTDALLCNVPSGLHDAFGAHFERTVRIHQDCPELAFLRASGYRVEKEIGKDSKNWVAYFYCKSEYGCPVRNDSNAIQQLERWLVTYMTWCDHKPSITVYVKPHELTAVKMWVYGHFEHMCGISFSPYSDLNYPQLPFREITEKEYEEAQASIVPLDWDSFRPGVQSSPGSACDGPSCTRL